jgi:hypothetical protein
MSMTLETNCRGVYVFGLALFNATFLGMRRGNDLRRPVGQFPHITNPLRGEGT